MTKIFLGTVVNTKGTEGKMFITDVPKGKPKVKKGSSIYIGYSNKFSKQFILKNWENLHNGVLISLVEITTPEEAKTLKENGIFVEENLVTFEDMNKLQSDAVSGFEVYNKSSGVYLGKVIDIWILPANDVWIVKTKEGNLPIPVLDEVIKKVDFDKKRIDIELIPGLIDLLNTEKEDK